MRLARTAAPLPRSERQGLAGRSRTCDLRCPRPAGWPSSPTTRRSSTPGGTRTRTSGLRARCHSTLRPRGQAKLRRQGSNPRLASNSRASSHSTTPERNGGSRIRTCGRAPRLRASNALPSAARPCLQAEGEGVEPPRPRSPPVFETGYRTHGSPSERVAPAGVEPAPHRLRVGGSSS
jgi:hypothetical protein